MKKRILLIAGTMLVCVGIGSMLKDNEKYIKNLKYPEVDLDTYRSVCQVLESVFNIPIWQSRNLDNKNELVSKYWEIVDEASSEEVDQKAKTFIWEYYQEFKPFLESMSGLRMVNEEAVAICDRVNSKLRSHENELMHLY